MVVIATGVALAVSGSYTGTNSNNTITGSSTADRIAGGGGDDTISGRASGDQLYGDFGSDKLNGETGNDELYGGSGSDTLLGDGDNDFINTADNRANDVIDCGTGTDEVVADVGDKIDTGEEDVAITATTTSSGNCEKVVPVP
jgi:Ca2+-binding RTX toxin-like protein